MRASAVDLSKLAPPAIVESLDFETILAARKARLREIMTDKGLLADWNPDCESDVLVAALEEQSYRELLFRQRVNDGARAVMLAFATGTNLDHLAANVDTARLDDEADDALRKRAQMAFEALSTAGPEGGYIYLAKSADARVADVRVTSPAPGDVLVTILTGDGDGIAGDDLIAKVSTAMPGNDDDGVRPLTDRVTVQAATKVEYEIAATLDLFDGVGQEVALAAAKAAAQNFAADQRALGVPVTLDGIYAALRVEGVKRVRLQSPTTEIAGGELEFANCTDIRIDADGGAA